MVEAARTGASGSPFSSTVGSASTGRAVDFVAPSPPSRVARPVGERVGRDMEHCQPSVPRTPLRAGPLSPIRERSPASAQQDALGMATWPQPSEVRRSVPAATGSRWLARQVARRRLGCLRGHRRIQCAAFSSARPQPLDAAATAPCGEVPLRARPPLVLPAAPQTDWRPMPTELVTPSWNRPVAIRLPDRWRRKPARPATSWLSIGWAVSTAIQAPKPQRFAAASVHRRWQQRPHRHAVSSAGWRYRSARSRAARSGGEKRSCSSVASGCDTRSGTITGAERVSGVRQLRLAVAMISSSGPGAAGSLAAPLRGRR